MQSSTDPDLLVELGRLLRARGYAFVCPTPATHAIVLARPVPAPAGLRDVFGWNRPFDADALDPAVFDLSHAGGLLRPDGARWRSRIRFSTAGDLLFAHSAYPTRDRDAVFFGPDTYRFAAFVRRTLAGWTAPAGRAARVLDLGCGSGAGGIVAARDLGAATELVLSDVNAGALPFAQANATLAGLSIRPVESDLFDRLAGDFDLILMNPPYLVDDEARSYRHGGDAHGMALPLRMVEQSIPRLRPGGLLLAYTGSPVIDGRDCFRTGVEALLQPARRLAYKEIDPDIFGEELAGPAYRDVDRIAAVTLRIDG